MKKVISILLCCMLFAVNVSAADDVAYSVDETIEYLEDGSYFVTKTEKISDSTGIQLFFRDVYLLRETHQDTQIALWC